MYYIEEIDNSKLEIFFNFIFEKSKKVSFKRNYQRGLIENLDLDEDLQMYYETGYMEKNVFDKIQENLKESIKDLYNGYYQAGRYTDIEELKKDYEEELDMFGYYLDYDKEIKHSKDLRFKCTSDEYLGNNITCTSYDTMGSFQELCFFKIENIAKNIVGQMNDLYDWEKFNIYNQQFYSFACWRNDEEVIFYTMPSDQLAILNLTNDEYEELFKLDLGIKLSK